MPIIDLPGSCEGCGGCCYGLIVEINPEVDFEVHNTPEDSTEILDDGKRYLKQDKEDNGRCVHLDAETRRCTIYETRPEVCRGFEMGHRACYEALSTMHTVQKRMSLAPESKVSVAISALIDLDQDDLQDTPIPHLIELQQWVLQLQGPLAHQISGRMFQDLREVRDQVAVMAVNNPDSLKAPKGTGKMKQDGSFAI